MTTYIEYELEDGGTLLVEVKDTAGGVQKAARGDGSVVIKATKKFRAALSSIKHSAATRCAQGFRRSTRATWGARPAPRAS